MATSHRVFSDLFELDDFIQQTAVSQGKRLIIDALREHFRNDTFYRYGTDAFGFPLTPDLTDLPPDIGEVRTTRIFIGDIFRYDGRYLPAITVRQTGGRYYAISFNQNGTYRYRADLIIDGYGNRSLVKVPTHKVYAGAWEQTFNVQIAAESIPDREELSDIVSSFLISTARIPVQDAGLLMKNVSFGGESEEDWANDKVYIQSINVETFSEWRREMPIDNVVETINFCFDYGVFGRTDGVNDVTLLTTEDEEEMEWTIRL
jgi:hypothetical protein